VPVELEITRREFRVDESGDTATVLLDAIGVDGTLDGEPFSFGFADGCVRGAAGGESFEQCSDGAFADTMGFLDEAPETKRLIDTITDAFADMEETGLELRRYEDLWYLSPTTTITEAVLNVLRALDRSELDAIIEQVPAAGEEIADDIFGSFGDFSGSFGDDFAPEIVEETFEETAPPATVEASEELAPPATVEAGEEPVVTAPTSADCYSVPDPDEALACFQKAVDAGEIDASFVPVALRHPECGYTASWGGGVYSLPDAEFIAAAEAARPCFLDLVEQGVVSEFELPSEIAYLECFEGRNWYNVFDDPEYDERYYDCLDQAFAD
jgi:hypothetical protein